jgi:transposase
LLRLTTIEQQKLELIARRPKTDQRTVLRARIVLACATGVDNQQVADHLDVCAVTVGKWRARFVQDGFAQNPASRSVCQACQLPESDQKL